MKEKTEISMESLSFDEKVDKFGLFLSNECMHYLGNNPLLLRALGENVKGYMIEFVMAGYTSDGYAK